MLTYVDQGYTGDRPASLPPRTGSDWRSSGTRRRSEGLCCSLGSRLSGAGPGSERSLARVARFRRMARDYERLPERVPKTVACIQFARFVIIMLGQTLPHLCGGSEHALGDPFRCAPSLPGFGPRQRPDLLSPLVRYWVHKWAIPQVREEACRRLSLGVSAGPLS